MCSHRQRLEVPDRTEEVRLLHHDAHVLRRHLFDGGHGAHLEVASERVGADDSSDSRIERLEQRYGVAPGDALREQAALGRGRGHVVEARVGDLHAGEGADGRLKLKGGLQRSLG